MARKTGSDGKKTAQELRLAATSLFARHGYAAVSMRQIATEVGVQAGALYLYTPDKQSLLFELMFKHMDELLQAWSAAKANLTDNPADLLEGFVRFHIKFHLQRIDEVFIAYMELRNLSPENFEKVTGQRRAYEYELRQILQLGAEQGVFDISDVKVATYGIIAMLTGINTWYNDAGRLPVNTIVELYLDMVQSIAAGKPSN